MVFAKQFLARQGIPTARFRACDTAAEAYRALADGGLGFPVVVKADGLAAGKGVVVAPDRASAAAAIRDAMEEGRFGAAGARVVIEECLRGPEASFFALCDGERAVPLRSAQDHKRAYDGDAGPNTGGMGAFSPSPLLDAGLDAAVMDTIVRPVLRGLAREGRPYRGFLYAGLMLTCTGPQVIEFNVRFGDPEAQVVLPAVAEPLARRLLDAARGSLDERPIAFADERFVGVVLASEGYPASGPLGREITGLDAAGRLPGVTVFHSGTAVRGDAVVTAGGRVLTVVGRGTSFEQAIERAYAGVSAIHFDGMHFRRDIGATTRGSQTV
jgi:phosphoribosylamine--glycine ligase